MLTSINDSIIEKAILTIDKLQGRDNWHIWSISIYVALGQTWEYVEGDKTDPPAVDNEGYTTWVKENQATHQRIWGSLSKDVKQEILPYAKKHASELFGALKV